MKLLLDTHIWLWYLLGNERLSSELIEICEALLNHEIAILSREIALPHQDPADRFIVATAIFYKLTLATVDGNLNGFSVLQIVS